MNLKKLTLIVLTAGLTACSSVKEGCNVPIYVAPSVNLERSSATAYTENLYERYARVDLLYLYNKDEYTLVEPPLESTYLTASEYGSNLKYQKADFGSYRPYGLDPLGNSGLNESTLDQKIVENVDLNGQSAIYLDKTLGFEFDSYALNDKVTLELDKHLYFMKKHRNIKVSLVGNADNIGPTEYNLTLSKNRANAVKDYLVKNGLSLNRISSAWSGEQGNGVGQKFRNVEVDYE
ncbi:OmpA family protein [Aliivibrio fischeri]|uniref:OmpA family protein n=1 Tax=Aliivibrio fischeri TaxID=668 RepID=UPI0012D85D79|nr:OmpA family protein [Aliivibrio fischeri]MUJ20394.1 OmpA family protein [Aliivibrio fischeri]